jgi:Tfp pilus assembly protein PilN
MININLLPEEIKNEIAVAKKNASLRQVLFRLIALLFIILNFFGVLFFFLINQKTNAIEQKKSAEVQINKQSESFNNAKDLFDRLKLIGTLDKVGTNWTKILNEIGDKTPASVQIDSFSVQAQAGNPKIKLSGNAATDKDVVAFKENLGKSDIFNYVDIESISKGSDPTGRNRELKSFTISFFWKEK